jgi:uncharacterized membrane protein
METAALFQTAIALFALGGLLISIYIHYKKQIHAPLTCPIGHSCDPVVHSRYSRFMDMPVEILGVIYYTIIVFTYLLFLAMPALYGGAPVNVLLVLSGIAFLFSLYLIGVQLFILREWCTWCLISAALCVAIFFAGLKLSGVELSLFLSLSFLKANSYKL